MLPPKQGSAQPLTGVVLDCGDGVSHVVPVVDGFVVGSRIKSMPIAGSNVTAFVQKLLRERSESIPPELSMEVGCSAGHRRPSTRSTPHQAPTLPGAVLPGRRPSR